MRILRSLKSMRHGDAWRLALGVMLLLLSGCVGAHAQAGTSTTVHPVHMTPLKVANGTAVRVGHYEPTNMLRLAFALTPPHPVEQAAFLEAVQDKTSPLFHQFLTAEEWNARFGPAAAEEQAVVDWAKSQGLTVTYRYGNRLVVDVEGQSGAIEKALQVSINTYQLPDANGGLTGPVLYSNDRDPVLPPSVAQMIQSVHGLNSIEAMHPASSLGGVLHGPDYVAGPAIAAPVEAQADAASADADPGAAVPSAAGLGGAIGPPTPGYYVPTDMWSAGAYDYLALMNQGHCCNPVGSAGGSPVQSSIGIAAFGDVSFNDVLLYHQAFPYLAYNLTKISIDGGYSCDNSNGFDDNCGEANLDTEASLAASNSRGSSNTTAHIYIYEAPNNGSSIIDVYNHMLDDGHARVFTTSWGCEEVSNCSSDSSMKSLDNVLASMAGQGWTLVAATGDQGATAGCGDAVAVQFPGSDPNVVGAGGTTLELYSNDQFDSEIGWVGGTKTGSCGKNGGGSTGGLSSYWNSPSYQSGLGYGKRAVPDLALNANVGQDIVENGSWGHIGGTSIVAPMLAGFFAQEDAYLLSLGNICGANNASSCAPLGNANYAIYEEGKAHNAGHVPFYDITSGCNSNDITALYRLPYDCSKAGYDLVTGWGSTNMLQLAWAINWEVTPATGIPYLTFSGPAKNKWYDSNQNVSWTVVDYAGGGAFKGTGIAGFTQGWDAIPGDAGSEPNQGGAANSFYSGPQYPNAKGGCLALATGQGCAGGVTQGCHTAHVRGWNNQGWSTGDQSYGPVCYDTVAPVINATITGTLGSNGWYVKQPLVYPTASDPGGSGASGLAHSYYAINSTTCGQLSTASCSTFNNSSILSITAQGKNTLTYFAEDVAGNFSKVGTIVLPYDFTAPVSKAGLSGALLNGNWETAVTVVLTATDNASGVAATYYAVDGAAYAKYASSFQITGGGKQTLKFYSVDVAGNTETAQSDSLTIDSLTTTTLGITPSPAALGTPVTIKATVTANAGGTPTGSVTFKNGASTLGIVTLANGSATLTTSTLPQGGDALSAVFGGSTYYLTSTSATTTLTVENGSKTTLTSSLNPAVFGQPVTLKAVVTGLGSLAGTITFKDGGATLGTVTAIGGAASLTNSTLAPGVHNLTALYNGSPTSLTSTSTVVAETVNESATTTTLTDTLVATTLGANATFTMQVTAASGPVPTGKVALKDGSTIIAVGTLNAQGIYVYKTVVGHGTSNLQATYSGSADDKASTSSLLTITVR